MGVMGSSPYHRTASMLSGSPGLPLGVVGLPGLTGLPSRYFLPSRAGDSAPSSTYKLDSATEADPGIQWEGFGGSHSHPR